MTALQDGQILAIVVLALGCVVFHYRRSMRYLQIFQQEAYTENEFLAWFWKEKAFDKRASLSLVLLTCIIYVVSYNFKSLPALVAAVGFIVLTLVWLSLSEEDPRKKGKVKLKVTERATRILRLAQWLHGALLGVLFWCSGLSVDVPQAVLFCGLLIPLVQSYPVLLLAANRILVPFEDRVQKGFAEEAKALIYQHEPFVIGITGSYGKTSTKHILAEILNVVSPTFTTPGSVNTYMGITRQIRENLSRYHKFAVIEMGAYYIGSIKKLCSLTPPRAAIITGIGLMHLERFGGQDAIQKAKSELAQAVPQDGILVCNGDDPRCREIARLNNKNTVLFYGFTREQPLDAYMHEIESSADGSTFKINWKGIDYSGKTKLLGKTMLANVLAAFTMSCALGLAPEIVLAAAAGLKPEKNRLQPEKHQVATSESDEPASVVTLHDAYNSNPVGFAAALDVLKELPGNRKILVTPGMIELGEVQQQENRKIANRAAGVCDLVVVVGDTNKDALVEGLNEGGFNKQALQCHATMGEALRFVYSSFCKGGDVVLIENDLPDRYEGSLVF